MASGFSVAWQFVTDQNPHLFQPESFQIKFWSWNCGQNLNTYTSNRTSYWNCAFDPL
jgi:hypothetical protein